MKECVFCKRNSTEVKISKEHVLPRYFKKRFPQLGGDVTLHRGRTIDWRPIQYEVNPVGHVFDMKVNRICVECNNEWLSGKIENPAEAPLNSLITGAPIQIDEQLCLTLALWAAKTALVRRLVDRPPEVSCQDPYVWMKSNMLPPPLCTVWIAKWDRTAFVRNTWFTMVNSESNELVDEGLWTVLGLGHIVFFVLYCAGPAAYDLTSPIRQVLESDGARCIFPVARGFADTELPLFEREAVHGFSDWLKERVTQDLISIDHDFEHPEPRSAT